MQLDSRRLVPMAVACLILWVPVAGWAMPGMSKLEIAQAGPAEALQNVTGLTAPCAPCFTCALAPSPTAQSTNQPDGQPRPSRWLEHRTTRSTAASGDAIADAALALPLRIAYCRWLN